MTEIRKATSQDIDAIKRIADANRDTLGFVLRPALQENIEKSWGLVAECDGQIVGFVNYRHRKDSQTTIYEICVSQEYRGQGIGFQLVDALCTEDVNLNKTSIQLKAMGGIRANNFYERYGFQLVSTETGKRQRLNVWRLTW